ncbi:MAG: hypothetical protein ACKEQK_00245 [Candidatus Hodgkinia cicadicola]
MAANMLKQAVPLLSPTPPLIGTGYEALAIRATSHNITTPTEAIVVSIGTDEVVVYEPLTKTNKVYHLPDIERTNQDTCFRLRCVVEPGQILKAGDAIAECQSSSSNELSLGVNLMVAFMCWKGFNYEDSIILSEDVVAEGLFQSLHIFELKTEVLRTAFGDEVLTNNLPLREKERFSDLPSDGIIRIGTRVNCNDVLVGKLTPTVKTVPDGISHINVESTINSSLYVPPNIESATVIDVTVTNGVSTANQSTSSPNNQPIDPTFTLRARRRKLLHDVRIFCSIHVPIDKLMWSRPIGLKVWQLLTSLLDKYNKDIEELSKPVFGVRVPSTSVGIKTFGYVDRRVTSTAFSEDDDSPDISESQVKNKNDIISEVTVKLLALRSIQVGDKLCGRHGNKGVVSRIVPREDMPFTKDGKPIDIILNPLGVPSRMNIGQILEAQLGLISLQWGKEFAQILKFYSFSNDLNLFHKTVLPKLKEAIPTLNMSTCTPEEALVLARELSQGVRFACPPFSKISDKRLTALHNRFRLDSSDTQTQLYDGLTGKPFDRKVTVGMIYMSKLNHMVEDKINVRATGPYSSVTQQPIKGKAHKGGQRLGEMEMWALQSHGAAFSLKEALTIKSDDVVARASVSSAIIACKIKLNTTSSESFNLLAIELKALCISLTTAHY